MPPMISVGRGQEQVVAGGIIVLICLEDANARWDDVPRQFCDKGHVAIHKGLINHEGVEVRAWKYGDLPARTVEEAVMASSALGHSFSAM
jgi:hypothetical protein